MPCSSSNCSLVAFNMSISDIVYNSRPNNLQSVNIEGLYKRARQRAALSSSCSTGTSHFWHQFRWPWEGGVTVWLRAGGGEGGGGRAGGGADEPGVGWDLSCETFSCARVAHEAFSAAGRSVPLRRGHRAAGPVHTPPEPPSTDPARGMFTCLPGRTLG